MSSAWRFKQLLAWRPNARNGHGRAIIAPGAEYVKRKMPVPGVLGGGAPFGVLLDVAPAAMLRDAVKPAPQQPKHMIEGS